jgi:hypothetical protein
MTPARADAGPYRFSGIGRPVDPSYATNRAILLLGLAGFAVAAAVELMAGAGWWAAGLSAGNAGVTVFLSWALTRELAPDDDPAAFVSVGLAGVGWYLLGSQSLLAPVVLLMAVRVVNRSTGKAAEPTDTLLLLPLFGFAAWTVSWTLGLVGAVALALDGTLTRAPGQRARRDHLWLSALLVAVAAARVLVGVPGVRVPVGSLLPMLLAALAALAGAVALVHPTPRSLGDVDGQPLQSVRVRSALLLGVLATVLVTLDAGVATGRLGLLWSCVAGTVVGFPFLLARRRR